MKLLFFFFFRLKNGLHAQVYLIKWHQDEALWPTIRSPRPNNTHVVQFQNPNKHSLRPGRIHILKQVSTKTLIQTGYFSNSKLRQTDCPFQNPVLRLQEPNHHLPIQFINLKQKS
jgi:hypothetical protein